MLCKVKAAWDKDFELMELEDELAELTSAGQAKKD